MDGNFSEREYARIGKALEAIVSREVGASSVSRMLIVRGFLKGFFLGLGSVIGATVGIAIFLWLLSVLGEIPFVGEIFDTAKQTIER